MRINKFLAQASGLSRRTADKAIGDGLVKSNGHVASIGQVVAAGDVIEYASQMYRVPELTADTTVIALHKPAGYVVSRNGQGSRTIYDLLPSNYHKLKPVGRLDKDSSGLLLLTDDGDLANRLTHPSYTKTKRYEVSLDKPLAPLHRQMISDYGIRLDDGTSRLLLERLTDNDQHQWLVTMHEGRNRQIRRTFASLGYSVTRLHRIQFGDYNLADLPSGEMQVLV
jgi:23S rRNA pseudouridine2605 synthase